MCPHARQGPGSEYNKFSHNDSIIQKHTHNPNGVQCMNCHQCTYDHEHCYQDSGGMADQGPHMKAAASKSGKVALLKTDLAAFMDIQLFLDTLGDDSELSCVSIDDVPKDLAELVVNSWSTLLNSGSMSHLIKRGSTFGCIMRRWLKMSKLPISAFFKLRLVELV